MHIFYFVKSQENVSIRSKMVHLSLRSNYVFYWTGNKGVKPYLLVRADLGRHNV